MAPYTLHLYSKAPYSAELLLQQSKGQLKGQLIYSHLLPSVTPYTGPSLWARLPQPVAAARILHSQTLGHFLSRLPYGHALGGRAAARSPQTQPAERAASRAWIAMPQLAARSRRAAGHVVDWRIPPTRPRVAAPQLAARSRRAAEHVDDWRIPPTRGWVAVPQLAARICRAAGHVVDWRIQLAQP